MTRVYKVSGVEAYRKHAEIVAESAGDAALLFQQEHGYMPDIIDDRELLAVCESCEIALFVDDMCLTTEDDCYLCEACAEAAVAAARREEAEDAIDGTGQPL